MPTPRTIVPAGYNPDLDRLPPRPAPGCSGAMVWGIALIAVFIGGALMMVRSLTAASAPARIEVVATVSPTETPIPATTTIDAWSMTGTALYFATITPTLDYCWWLTPTATTTATLEHTPDSWQATGTAFYHATYPPMIATATPDVPTAWCDYEATTTPTMTPLRLGGMVDDTTTQEVTPEIRQTNTAVPTLQQDAPPVQQPVQPPTTVYVPPTNETVLTEEPAPLPTVQPTATRKKRATKTPTNTPTSTDTATEYPTLTYTPTCSPIFTPTATGTPTLTYTPICTPIFTPTATATETLTLTFTPTATATEYPTLTYTPTFTLTPTDTETVITDEAPTP